MRVTPTPLSVNARVGRDRPGSTGRRDSANAGLHAGLHAILIWRSCVPPSLADLGRRPKVREQLLVRKPNASNVALRHPGCESALARMHGGHARAVHLFEPSRFAWQCKPRVDMRAIFGDRFGTFAYSAAEVTGVKRQIVCAADTRRHNRVDTDERYLIRIQPRCGHIINHSTCALVSASNASMSRCISAGTVASQLTGAWSSGCRRERRAA